MSTMFKKAQCIDVDIDFIGVWDTVDSVGFIRGKELPFTKHSAGIKVFRHALSLDERRAKFTQFRWHWAINKETKLGVKKGDMPKAGGTAGKARGTNVRELWFAGCHSGTFAPIELSSVNLRILRADVGGTATAALSDQESTPLLGHISLRWMIQQCFEVDTGIRFDHALLTKIGLEFRNSVSLETDGFSIMALRENKPTVKKDREDLDAMADIHDQLSEHKLWWLLEVCPLSHPVQKKDGNWDHKRVYVLVSLLARTPH